MKTQPGTGPEHHTGLYLHIPFCKARCRFCGFYFETDANDLMEPLVAAEVEELQRFPAGIATTAYIGGGSPTALGPARLGRLINAIYDRHPRVGELTLECNPEQVTRNALDRWRELGVTRLSLGAQSFNDRELAWMGRTHRSADTVAAVEAARQAGFDNIGMDLIFALPHSTEQTWQHTLDMTRALTPAHCSIYGLSVEPDTPLDAQIRSGRVAPLDEAQDRAQYLQGIDTLEGAGLRQYEISNFARKGYRCRHNEGYWYNQPYLGIGPSASSYWQGRRTSNVASIDHYLHAIDSDQCVLAESVRDDAASRACETAILNLRMRRGIHIQAFHETTGYDIMRRFAEPIARYRALGLLCFERGRLFLTRQALPIADSVLCEFAALP